MEPFARKKAIDGMFLGLKTWVKSSANNIVKVIYANLLKEENECFSLKRVCFFSIMTLASDCRVYSLRKRINMKDV